VRPDSGKALATDEDQDGFIGVEGFLDEGVELGRGDGVEALKNSG
jgi:hypothetical protein